MKKRIVLLFLLTFAVNAFGAVIAQWKMNDDADDAVVTDSIASYTGTYYDENTPATITSDHTVAGQLNGGLELDGTNDYITVADAVAFTPNGSPLSIAAWVSLSANEGALDFMIANKMGTALEWDFSISGDALGFTIYDEDAAPTPQRSLGRQDTTTDYSSWEGSGYIFVVGTYDGGATESGIKLYLSDTQVDDSDNSSGGFVNCDDTDEDIEIGRYGVSMAEGEIDNLMIFNTVLTQAQITSLYNDGTGTEDASLGGSDLRTRISSGYRYEYRSRY